MKLTTNGIGVSGLSLTKSGVHVYGNDKFRDWVGGGAKLSRVTLVGTNRVWVFVRDLSGLATKPRPNGVSWWTRAWSNQQPHPPMADFGATEPVAVRLNDKNQLEVEMPAVCAKVLRPKGVWKKRAREVELEAGRYTPPVEPELPLAAAQPEPAPELVTLATKGTPEMCAQPTKNALQEAVATINKHKGLLGPRMLITVLDDGRLRVFTSPS